MLHNKKALLFGALFGLFAPFIGLFIGLQLSPVVANVLMFPIIGLSAALGEPFGMWSISLKLLGLVLSIVAWAIVFWLIAKLITRS